MPTDILGERHIMVVDDDDQISQFLARILQAVGKDARITLCGSAEEALRHLEAFLPDLLLMDLAMPVIDGYQLLGRIRGNPRTAGVPVIVITGQGTLETEVDVLDSGADDFVPKPINRIELLARVRSLLRRQAHQQALTRRVDELEGKLRSLSAHLEAELGTDRARELLARVE
jgi:DNA-binding response OmpR family regulator